MIEKNFTYNNKNKQTDIFLNSGRISENSYKNKKNNSYY